MEISVRFTHPHNNTVFLADVSRQLTAQQALMELCSPSTGPFLQPPPQGQEYQLILHKTGYALPPAMTMGSAGVQDNDTLAVAINAQAAMKRLNMHSG